MLRLVCALVHAGEGHGVDEGRSGEVAGNSTARDKAGIRLTADYCSRYKVVAAVCAWWSAASDSKMQNMTQKNITGPHERKVWFSTT